MNIRIATFKDLDKINELFTNVVEDIQNNKKIDMLWDNEYPFCKFNNDINDKKMYILEEDENIIGSFVIDEYDDPDYNTIDWNYKNKKFFYINRLAISANYQCRGYSKIAMDFIENYAVENKYEVIRLTVHEKNTPAISLYEKYGFKKVESGVVIIFGEKFIGYEKTY